MLAWMLAATPAFAQVTIFPGGITQLTSDCMAGPGVGSQPIVCTKTNGNDSAFTIKLPGINLNSTGDTTVTIPSSVTRYQVSALKITNCSTTPTLAQAALWTGAGGTGTAIVVAATLTGASAAAIVLNSALATTNFQTSTSLFIRVSVANGSALTCDFYLSVQDLT